MKDSNSGVADFQTSLRLLQLPWLHHRDMTQDKAPTRGTPTLSPGEQLPVLWSSWSLCCSLSSKCLDSPGGGDTLVRQTNKQFPRRRPLCLVTFIASGANVCLIDDNLARQSGHTSAATSCQRVGRSSPEDCHPSDKISTDAHLYPVFTF